MLDWGSLTPQIIIATIGIMGSLIVLFLTNIGIESNRPNLDIILPYDTFLDTFPDTFRETFRDTFLDIFLDIFPDTFRKTFLDTFLGEGEDGHITMDVVNLFGKTSATNIMIRIEVLNNDIIHHSIWSTENSKILSNNSKLLLVNIPRLASGEGAMVNIGMDMKTKSITAYKVFTSFDQGSKYTESNSIWSNTFGFYFVKTFSSIIVVMVILGFLALFIFAFIAAIYAVYFRPKKERANKFISKLMKDILEIRSVLRDGEKNRDKIESVGEWMYYTDEYKEQIFKTMQFIGIDDFYSHLTIRNSKVIEQGVTDEQVIKINSHIVSLADNVLKFIKIPKFSAVDDFMGWLLKKIGMSEEGFAAELSGFDEVPRNNSIATGTAEFRISPDGRILTCKINTYDIRGILRANLYRGTRGGTGHILAVVFEEPGDIEFGNWESNTKLSAKCLDGELKGKGISDLIKLMERDETYLDIQTQQFPNGEIRGQLIKTLL